MGEDIWFPYRHLKFFGGGKMSKLKEGDKVRVIKASTSPLCLGGSGNGCCKKYLGKVGVVCETGQTIGVRGFEETFHWCGAFSEDCLELLTGGAMRESEPFRIGDKVEVINSGNVYSDYQNMAKKMCAKKWKENRHGINGEIGDVRSIEEHERYKGQILALVDFGVKELIIGIEGLRKIKGGMEMSRYDELTEQIGRLTGWDKEADDLLFEIYGSNKNHYEVVIGIGHASEILIQDNNKRKLVDFVYRSQWDKLEAFKSACLWLLDHSNIKKDERVEKIEELEYKIAKMQAEINRLKGPVKSFDEICREKIMGV